MKANRNQYKRKWISAARTLASNNIEPPQIAFNINQLPNDLHNPSYLENYDLQPDPHILHTAPELVNDDNDNVDIDNFEIGWDSIVENLAGPASSSDSEDSNSEENLHICLVKWVNDYQIKHNAVDSLLKILIQSGHPNLPASARSLLKTDRCVPTEVKSGMEYIYFPIKEELLKHFMRYPTAARENTTTLEISLNIDGLPLFKSTNKSIWPILCGIMNLQPVTIFPVALTYGSSKPSDLLFLQDTVDDLNDLLEHGLHDGERKLAVSVKSIMCDAPARALVKGTKLYSGYYGCDKCAQKGEWIGRITYPETRNVSLRTNSSFRRQSNCEHHHHVSPFCDLPIDMVKKFPIDYMHQLCLGVMRKLILLWMRGNREFRISARQVEEISSKLIGLKSSIPKCFARKPRSLREIDRWKATELRQFLLYTGKIALDGILRSDLYAHFMSLSVASDILVSPSLGRSHCKYAGELLVYFVEKGCMLYGNEFMVYNVHSMIHLAAEVEEFGSLDQCSSFPFENYMQKLKRMVRSGKNPIAQVAKRLSEIHATKIPELPCTSTSVKKPDNAYIINSSSCCEVVEDVNQCDEEGNHLFLCRVYDSMQPLFKTPCDSRIVGVYLARRHHTKMKQLPSRCLSQKAIMFEHEDSHIFMSILHTV